MKSYFCIRNIIKFENLKGAVIICTLNNSLDIWVFKNFTIVTNKSN